KELVPNFHGEILWLTLKPRENMAENFESQIFCIMGHDVIMPERLSAAKKFGYRSRHRITALLRLSLRDSWKNIASAWETATVKSRPNDFWRGAQSPSTEPTDD